jgi:hypothetical protein
VDDGKLLGRVPFKTSYGRHCATPVAGNDWVLAGSYKAGLIGVKVLPSGAGLKADWIWTNKAMAMNFSSPVLVGRHLYGLGPAKNLFCVEVETGKLAWSKEGYFMTSADVAHASFLGMGQLAAAGMDHRTRQRRSDHETQPSSQATLGVAAGDNLQRKPAGSTLIPRRGGRFLWEQFHELSQLAVDCVYVAMFDEVDEGTAIFKITSSPPAQPLNV